MNIEKGFKDDEIKIQRVGGPRAKGFRVMIEKFQAKVCFLLCQTSMSAIMAC